MAGKSLKFDLLVNTTQFARKLKEADNQAGRFSQNVGHHMSSAAKGFAAAAIGVGSVAEAVHGLKDSVEVTEALAKATAQLSRTTGLDATTASEWVSVTKTRGSWCLAEGHRFR
jgi:hypothetical protein